MGVGVTAVPIAAVAGAYHYILVVVHFAFQASGRGGRHYDVLGEEVGRMTMWRGRRGMDPQGDCIAKRRRRAVRMEVVMMRVGARERGRGRQGGGRVVRMSVVELLLLFELLLALVGGIPSRLHGLGRVERHVNSK